MYSNARFVVEVVESQRAVGILEACDCPAPLPVLAVR